MGSSPSSPGPSSPGPSSPGPSSPGPSSPGPSSPGPSSPGPSSPSWVSEQTWIIIGAVAFVIFCAGVWTYSRRSKLSRHA